MSNNFGSKNPLTNQPANSAQRQDLERFAAERWKHASEQPTPNISPLNLLQGLLGKKPGVGEQPDDRIVSEYATDQNGRKAEMPIELYRGTDPLTNPFGGDWCAGSASNRVSMDGDEAKFNFPIDDVASSEVTQPYKTVTISPSFAFQFNSRAEVRHEDVQLMTKAWSEFAKDPKISKKRQTSICSQKGEYRFMNEPGKNKFVWRDQPHKVRSEELFADMLINHVLGFAVKNSSQRTLDGLDLNNLTREQQLDIILAQKMTDWGDREWQEWKNEKPDRTITDLTYDECVALDRRGELMIYSGMGDNTKHIRKWMSWAPFPFGAVGAPTPHNKLLEGYSDNGQDKLLATGVDHLLTGGAIFQEIFKNPKAIVAVWVARQLKEWQAGTLAACNNEHGHPAHGPHFIVVSKHQKGEDHVPAGQPEKVGSTNQLDGIHGSTKGISWAKITAAVRAIVSPEPQWDKFQQHVLYKNMHGCHSACNKTDGAELNEGIVTKILGTSKPPKEKDETIGRLAKPPGEKKKKKSKKEDGEKKPAAKKQKTEESDKEKPPPRPTVPVTCYSLGYCTSIRHIVPGTAVMNECNKTCFGYMGEIDFRYDEQGNSKLHIEVRDFCKCASLPVEHNPCQYKCTKIQWAPRRVARTSVESVAIMGVTGGVGLKSDSAAGLKSEEE